MEFEVYAQAQTGTKRESNVDWDAYHEYIIETAGLQDREVLPGVITFIADLGVQNQPDAEFEFTGTEEDEAAEIEENPNTYFKTEKNRETGKIQRLKCWPQKPIQAVALAVDFPEIQLDYGQFFGDDSGETKPLRVWVGGQFFMDGKGMTVARPVYLKENKKLGDWSFDQKSLPYQIAVASKIIKAGEVFKAGRIGALLGKTVNWNVQIFNKENKGKSYFTEFIKFASGLTRSQAEPQYDGKLHATMFNRDNDADSLKELRNHVRNTMSLAANYEGSKIQAQIEAMQRSKQESSSSGEDEKEEEKPVVKKEIKPKSTPKRTPVADDFDSDSIPF